MRYWCNFGIDHDDYFVFEIIFNINPQTYSTKVKTQMIIIIFALESVHYSEGKF